MATRHDSVSCDNCLQTNFEGMRFKCLVCLDYDLCERCHTLGATTERHLTTHPMQCMLTSSETSALYSGDGIDAFTCPHCGQYGYKSDELAQHVSTEHNNTRTPVICPICIVLTTNDPNQMVSDLAQHMRIEHNTQQQQQGRSRRGDTIRELRRIIYPSRGMRQQVTASQRSSHRSSANSAAAASAHSRDVPFTFVPDPNDQLASMEDSLNDLLQQLGTHPSAPRRFNPAERLPQRQRGDPQPERIEPPVPDIPRRLLLDNLSDEEEQVPDDIKREKCHFFQDLLLSTLTEQKLTMKVSDADSSLSAEKPNRQSDKCSKSSSRVQKKKNKENNNNNLSTNNRSSNTTSMATNATTTTTTSTTPAANNHIESSNRPSSSDELSDEV